MTDDFGILDRGWGKPTQLIEAQAAREVRGPLFLILAFRSRGS
jgi:hypothetical protein